MTRTTNARLAGFTFLLYIAAGITSLVLSGRATRGEGMAAKLASIAQHATDMRVVVLLTLLTSFCAVVLGVTLYAITREQAADLAMLGLTCRLVEGVNGAVSVPSTLGLLWLATTTGPNAPHAESAQALGAFLLRDGSGVSATFFAVGSTLFSWLLLRGRMIPTPMAWLGVVASALLVVLVPLQFTGLLGSGTSWYAMVTWLTWLPMLVFELGLAGWFLVKGVKEPCRSAA